MPRVNHKKVCQALSTARMSAYRQTTDAKTLQAYASNVKLSEALYVSIQQLEVVLRNRFEIVLVKEFGTTWFTNTDFLLMLESHGRTQIFSAIDKIIQANKPLVSGAIVAELTFGFWTFLLNKKYEFRLWNPHDHLLFPNAIPHNRNIKIIREEFTKIRQLRNRIAHHEPINKQPLELWSRYETIVKLLGWMNPDVTHWLISSKCDRFPSVFNAIFNPKPRKRKTP